MRSSAALGLLGLVSMAVGARAGEFETVVSGPAGTGPSREVVERPWEASEDVAGALGLLPGATVEQNVRGEWLVVVDGFDQKRLLVRLWDVPIAVPYTGQMNLGLFPSGLLGGLLVIHGPDSIRSGATGLGGTLGLLTSPLGGGSGSTVRAGARPGGWTTDWSVRFGTGGWQWQTCGAAFRTAYSFLPADWPASRNEDGGRRDNSDRTVASVAVQGRWRVAPGHELRLLGVGILGGFGVPPHVDSPLVRHWRFSDVGMALAELKYRYVAPSGHRRVRAAVWGTAYRDVLDAYEDASLVLRDSDAAFHSIYEDWSSGVVLTGSQDLRGPTGRWILRFLAESGVTGHRQRGDLTFGPVYAGWSRFAAEAEWRLLLAHRIVAQVQVEGDWPVWGSGFDSSWAVEPLLLYGFVRGRWDVAAKVGRRVRFPTLRERFSDGRGRRVPNPDLDPESGWVADVSPRLRLWGPFALEAGVHAAYVRDLIDERLVEPGKVMQDNVGTALVVSGRLTAEARWGGAVWARVSYVGTYLKFLEGSEGLWRVRPHRLVVEVQATPSRRLVTRLWLDVASSTRATDPDTGVSVSLGPRAIVSLSARFRIWSGLWAWWRFSNLLDVSYLTAPGMPGPGLSTWAGLMWRS